MRRKILGGVALGALAVCLAWPAWPTGASAAGEGAAVNFGFGLQIAGSYLVTFEQQDPLPRDPVPALATFHADGGFTATDVATMFGAGNRDVIGFRSPIHGNWTRTRRHELTFRMLGFGYDAEGNLGTANLAGGSMLRTTGTLTFEDGTLSGPAILDVFLPGQDPLDPGEAPAFSFPIQISGRRI